MEEFVKGGAFLVESISPQEVFTPEEFTEEQRLIAKAATEFAMGEVQPQEDDIEAQKEGLLASLKTSLQNENCKVSNYQILFFNANFALLNFQC